MDKRNKFKVRGITDEELDGMYGSNLRYKVGSCFKENEHYYMQRENDVLHIFDKIINTLHNSSLDKGVFENITEEQFNEKIKTTIFEMGIYKYVKEKI